MKIQRRSFMAGALGLFAVSIKAQPAVPDLSEGAQRLSDGVAAMSTKVQNTAIALQEGFGHIQEAQLQDAIVKAIQRAGREGRLVP